MRKSIVLVDLPTFPKGTVSLSLPYLAGIFGREFEVHIFDLNFQTQEELLSQYERLRPTMVGIKVCSQNHHIAQDLTDLLRTVSPAAPIVWGGEFPTLMPDLSTNHADCVVKGLFDSVADEFMKDLHDGKLKREYIGKNNALPDKWTSPDWSMVKSSGRYNRFMGLPLETTRGCTESCTFCMVLIMQNKHYHTRPLDPIASDIRAIGQNHINIIDYNFGVDAEHVKNVCSIIEHSEALGFMAEMCIELLDDDSVLEALAKARCRMIYCGLETIDEVALKSVGKDRTNSIANYRRIIRKAQLSGVNIASGFILGMEHSTFDSYKSSLAFFKEMGIMYVKLTFLTFNPGTRSQMFYRKKGQFLTEDPRKYDGNHLTFLPSGMSENDTYEGARWFIENFYSLSAILKRAKGLPSGLMLRSAFCLFNLCYREVYLTWLEEGALRSDWDSEPLLRAKYRKPWRMRLAETALLLVWKRDRDLKS